MLAASLNNRQCIKKQTVKLMTGHRANKYENVTTLKKISVISGLFVFLFGGIFTAVIAISNFENYLHPYLFGFTFGTVGLLVGLYVSKKLKPHVILNPKMLSNYSLLSILFSVGFIGCFMLFGLFLNGSLSALEKCDNFIVVEKQFRKRGYRQAQLNILVANINGKNQRLLCKPRS